MERNRKIKKNSFAVLERSKKGVVIYDSLTHPDGSLISSSILAFPISTRISILFQFRSPHLHLFDKRKKKRREYIFLRFVIETPGST